MIYCPKCGTGFEVETPQPLNKNIVEEYTYKDPNKVERAIPEVSEYRKRYLERRLTGSDVTAPPAKLSSAGYSDDNMDKFGNLVIGTGLEREI